MLDWNTWFVYLLYVEMGVLVGVFLKQKFVPPMRKEDGSFSYGTLGQFALGAGITFGFHLLGTDYMQAWAASTAIASTGNLLPLGIDKVNAALEVRRTQTSINDLKGLIEDNSQIMDEFTERMIDTISKFAKILAMAEEAKGIITGTGDEESTEEESPVEPTEEVIAES